MSRQGGLVADPTARLVAEQRAREAAPSDESQQIRADAKVAGPISRWALASRHRVGHIERAGDVAEWLKAAVC